jgi:hypothetical protein
MAAARRRRQHHQRAQRGQVGHLQADRVRVVQHRPHRRPGDQHHRRDQPALRRDRQPVRLELGDPGQRLLHPVPHPRQRLGVPRLFQPLLTKQRVGGLRGLQPPARANPHRQARAGRTPASRQRQQVGWRRTPVLVIGDLAPARWPPACTAHASAAVCPTMIYFRPGEPMIARHRSRTLPGTRRSSERLPGLAQHGRHHARTGNMCATASAAAVGRSPLRVDLRDLGWRRPRRPITFREPHGPEVREASGEIPMAFTTVPGGASEQRHASMAGR